MKRSEINRSILDAIALFESMQFKLPPFALWSPEQWQQVGEEAREILDNGLGWDVTDYGKGDFSNTGLLLFTIRNGNYGNRETYPKGYAEKIMVVQENQMTPWHFHWNKREDIINRGGGDLVVELYLADENDKFSDKEFEVTIDGIRRKVAPGGTVVLTPGESICLEPYVYHTFYGREGGGTVMVGEVSDVNDDANDNRFYDEIGRFPTIEEDEPPTHYLCTEYPELKK
ncbi:D-lyxose/D-mannose family sugar isomerase [Desulfosediminicola ganghwensis]|uniref:D-lyxose/D-mannose family sugar isomerase n=1 Tax=Desulfosediminicola ganghwensis TaxID=2569540 RepID=UPI0010AB6A66|nr:D-lyxose/D-mannose family sugar isomerase [Desulfosediminicola ganghwensis]